MAKEPLKQKEFPEPKARASVVQSAAHMAAGTLSSRILGFVRDALMYALFPSRVTDCFVVAFRVPNLFRRLLGEGSLSPSFIPVYVEQRRRSEAEARGLSNAVFSIMLALAVVLSVIGFIYMDQLMWFIVGDPRGFAADPTKVAQTIYLARIMIFYLLLVTTFAFHLAIANTHGRFFVPALGPTLFNFGLILFTVTRWELGPYAGSTQSWGVIFGGVLQVSVVAWVLVRERALPTWTWNWRVAGVGHVFRNLLPSLLGLGVFQAMTLVNTKFAASLAEGAQSCIYAADRILELPQSLIAVSLGAALLPRFSELQHADTRAQFLSEANGAVRALLFLALPAAGGMFTLAPGITQVLFMRGAFSAENALRTAGVVEIYGFLMLFSSLARVTAPAFYALKKVWIPAGAALSVLAIHILLGRFLVDRFGLNGLAAATSVSSILNVLILQVFFYFWIGALGYGRILLSVFRLVPALIALGGICYFGYDPLVGTLASVVPIGPARVAALGAVILSGMMVYFFVSRMCRSPEAERVSGMLLRRFFKTNGRTG